MSDPLLTLGLGCLLQTSVTTVKGAEGAWAEVVVHTIHVDSVCDEVTVAAPKEASLNELIAHTFTERGKRRVENGRFGPPTTNLTGREERTIFVPELTKGDQLTLEVRRTWHTPGYRWQPATLGSHPATLKAPKDAPWHIRDVLGAPADGRIHLPTPDSSDLVTLGNFVAPRPPPLPAAPPRERWQHTLHVPEGDPQVSLFPGGGSSVAVQGELAFDPRASARAWVIPVRPGYTQLEVRVSPDEAATLETRPDSLLVLLDPSEIRTQVWVAWTEPDAPTFGHLNPDGDTQIRVEDGVIQWEPSAQKWWLQSVHGRPVMPHSKALLAALDRRFLNATLKEPALPSPLRGAAPDVSVVEALTLYIRDAVVESNWPQEPTLPRPVTRAIRAGAASPVEGGLALQALLAQANIDSRWALVHPAPSGPGGKISLEGYTHMLLELEVNGSAAWIDPLCAACDLFEVRPDLEGATPLGHTTGGAPVTLGLLEASFTPDLAKWTLSGSASTHLRLAWTALPHHEREGWLAANFWPGATVRLATGLDEPGATILLEMTDGTGVPYDPLSLPAARTLDDTAWLPWVGTRRVTRTSEGGAASGAEGPLEWTRTIGKGTTTETLTNTSRWLPGSSVRSIENARKEGAPPTHETEG